MPEPEKNTLKIDPGTLVLIVSVLILLPLLLAGFFAH
jgi:preprotein translocase subunit Sec61beta